MKRYRYCLDPSSKKYRCPNCGQFSLVIFIDTETGEILENYGRCDRESKCGFFYHPSKDGFKNCKGSTVLDRSNYEIFPSFHKYDLVELSMNYDNNLLKYLRFLLELRKRKGFKKNIRSERFPNLAMEPFFGKLMSEKK